jgi:hypothetical protein
MVVQVKWEVAESVGGTIEMDEKSKLVDVLRKIDDDLLKVGGIINQKGFLMAKIKTVNGRWKELSLQTGLSTIESKLYIMVAKSLFPHY